MKARLFAAAALATTLGLAATATAADQKTIAETVADSKDHSILLAALSEAKWYDTLGSKGSFTLFAPTDAAFKKLGEAKMKEIVADQELFKKIVAAHVVKERVIYIKELVAPDGQVVNGFTTSTKDGLMIGPAKVTTADVKCSNGVIHFIDTVLIPK